MIYYFGVGGLVILLVILLARGINKEAGSLGCLFIIIVLVVMTCVGIEEEIDKDRERKEKMDDAVDDIRRTKQMYIDSGWVKPPRM